LVVLNRKWSFNDHSLTLLYVPILNTTQQFDWFRRGFTSVCGGDALSLFRPEEIEFLVRGSAEPLDIDQLRSVTVYEGFNDNHEVIR
jgi:E3 ubiquitin-protein ligase HECTD2